VEVRAPEGRPKTGAGSIVFAAAPGLHIARPQSPTPPEVSPGPKSSEAAPAESRGPARPVWSEDDPERPAPKDLRSELRLPADGSGIAPVLPAPLLPSPFREIDDARSGGRLFSVREPPLFVPVVGSDRCTGCERALSGFTGYHLCWGCGREICATCYWRHGTGARLHRCPSCAAAEAPE
jgi:hypothetical protein